MATKKKTAEVEAESEAKIIALEKNVIEIRIRGISPLIVHKFSEKAQKQIQAKHAHEAKQKKEARDPYADFLGALYVIKEPSDAGNDGVYGFPASGIKKAIVAACRYADGITMTYAKGSFYVLGEDEAPDLVRIIAPAPRMRTDVVRLSGMSPKPDMRYRPEFKKGWEMNLKIMYNKRAISLDQLVNLINGAGFGVGIGEWRPERSGSWGMFEVVNG